MVRAGVMVTVVTAFGAGCTHSMADSYDWGGERVVCSMSVDNIWHGASHSRVIRQMEWAAATSSVALFHAHDPGLSLQRSRVEFVLQTARDNGLAILTYADLDAGPPRAGIALAFDDTFVDDWAGLEDLFALYDAHVTFFVTEYAQWSDAQKAELAQLASQGHSVEAHGVHHLNALDYLSTHTAEQYVTDEIVPSIDILRADGYDVTAFAFPQGASNDALDDAALEVTDRVRVGPGSCPY